MDNVQVDIITHIPDEIKLVIFQHLDSFSVITLAQVSKKFAEVSCDKKISSNLSLYVDYRFKLIHLQSFLLHELRREIITSLNINCVYWIPKDQMKKCLSLHMLKSLYAIDTKLDLHDFRDSNLPNLNVLAITERCGCTLPTVLKNLKKLQVQCSLTRRCYFLIMSIFNDCKKLEELWLLDLSNESFTMNIKRVTKSLKRFVTKSDYSVSFTLPKHKLNTVTFKSERGTTNICLENTNMNIISNIYECNFYESLENQLWTTYLNEFKSNYPFGFHDAKKLVYKQETLESLYFEELSMNHMNDLCCEKLRSTVVSILALPNTKLLRKLSIDTCIFGDYSETSDINEPLCKRRRTTEVCTKRSKLDVIVEHLPLLEELEIFECINTPEWNPDVLRSIGKLSKLKSLVLLYVSNIGHGNCLLDICKSCTNLTSLKIWCFCNLDLNNHLCMSIPYLRMLKDLRYQEPYLPLDRILEGLASNNSHKLERVVLWCNEIETFSSEPLKKFITQNPQLRFLYIMVNNLSEAARIPISNYLKEMESDQQIFIVRNSVAASLPLHLIPQIHVLEILNFYSTVGVIHPFNDFH